MGKKNGSNMSFKNLIKKGFGLSSTKGIHGEGDNTLITDNSIVFSLSVFPKWASNKRADYQRVGELNSLFNEAKTASNTYKVTDDTMQATEVEGETILCWKDIPLYVNKKYYDMLKVLKLDMYVQPNRTLLGQLMQEGKQEFPFYNIPIAIKDNKGEIVGLLMGIKPKQ